MPLHWNSEVVVRVELGDYFYLITSMQVERPLEFESELSPLLHQNSEVVTRAAEDHCILECSVVLVN